MPSRIAEGGTERRNMFEVRKYLGLANTSIFTYITVLVLVHVHVHAFTCTQTTRIYYPYCSCFA